MIYEELEGTDYLSSVLLGFIMRMVGRVVCLIDIALGPGRVQ